MSNARFVVKASLTKNADAYDAINAFIQKGGVITRADKVAVAGGLKKRKYLRKVTSVSVK